MATPRYRLVDQQQPMFYHLVSRCVRRSWLCGRDPVTKRRFSHRKVWLVKQLYQLAQAFPIEVHAYAVMSNHFHLVVYYDPQAAIRWSDDEVVERWAMACPAQADKQRDPAGSRHTDPEKLVHMRKQLGSLSFFMKLLKQPIARRANLEDECTGHFFEQRYYSGALLSENAVIAAMAYVDLNPVRAKVIRSIEQLEVTSLIDRLDAEKHQEALEDAVKPLVSGLEPQPRLSISLQSYIDIVSAANPDHTKDRGKQTIWYRRTMVLKRRQRVYGPIERIQDWINARGMSLREQAMI